MASQTRIIGVHPVHSEEPVYLLEIELRNPDAFDWGSVTQRMENVPADNWQAASDEQGAAGNNDKYAFFFHYLDLTQPLSTSDGDIKLPPPSEVPEHLQSIEYERP